MELREGENVGPFQVQKRIGAGGMGVVYRARDTRLGRDVAIKVLPAVVSSDPDRLARIRREAQLLASLNHPHIAAIHGLEEVDGQPLLVLELVEGPDLSDRLSRGRLAVEDAVDLARQMAEALEAAHAKGIIHRDLKPGNIKLTEDGAIKILDFGLAKAFLEEGVDASSQLSHSPTISRPATATGAIMGTAAYMSPEQAKGKHLDRRTDIWSFGCVLFEMLVGRKVFSGETVSETLAEILKSEPDWSALPSDVPEPVRRLLQRALTKDPKHRLRDIGDAWVTLSEASGGGPNPVMAVAAPPAARSKRVSIGAAVVIATLASIVSAIVAVRRDRGPSPEAHPVRRFTLRLGERPLYSVWSNLAVSPRGNLVAFLTRLDGSRKLVLRHFEKETDDVVPESNDASYLFFSPDGEWVAFITAPESNSGSPRHGTLKRVRVSGGGAPVTIREEVFAGGGIWLDDDTIVFQSGDGERLERISSSGGASNPLTLPPGGGLWFPVDGVPGSRDLLLVNGGGDSIEDSLFLVPVTSGAPRKIADKVSMALYEPSGYLVCFHAGQLLSMPFDRERREVRGSGVPLANGTALLGWGISREGSLVYAAQPPARLVWVSRTGVEEATAVPVGHYLTPRLAPDGTRVALSTLSTMVENPDVWIFDLARSAMTRFTTEPGRDYAPLWTPDGRRLYFTHQDTRNTILGKADGASIAEPLLTSGSELWPSGWLHDGTTMVVERDDYKGTGSDIAVLPRGAADTTPLIHEPLDQSNPAISPDGRLIAYESNETGRMEVYVRRLPGLEDRTQVSRVGGMLPLWGRDSAELFYVEGDKMMAAGIESAPTLRVSDSHMLFRGDYRINAARDHDYDRRHDRFLMLKDDTSEGDPRDLHVVLNWTAEAKRLAVQERR